MDVEPAQVEAALARIKPQVEAQDFELVARLWSTLVLVMRLVRAQRASIAGLRRMFGLSSSEKTREVIERMQRNLQTPLSSSTQWEALDQRAPEVKPVFQHLEHVAAQGTVIHNDDSYVRILA
jgi:hypothetical protein